MTLSKAINVKNKLDSKRIIKVIEFDQSKSRTKPHRHNGYLEIVYLSDTSGKHVIDGREYVVTTPCLLVIKKDSVHNWELRNPVEGFVILIKDDFVQESLDFEIRRLVNILTQYDTLYFKDEINIKYILRILAQEENKVAQEGLFKAFLSKVLENQNFLKGSTSSVSSTLYHQFCSILNQEDKIVNHVAHYALKLNTTPQNLNAVCKKNMNLTASDLLGLYIVREAKRLLIYTSSSVSEVAFTLGFSDGSNFSKYFKRYVGISPSEFKKSKN